MAVAVAVVLVSGLASVLVVLALPAAPGPAAVASRAPRGASPSIPPGVIPVTAFGADPSGRRDSTLAIRRAIAAAEARRGWQTVYFPAGTYLLDRDDGRAADFVIDHATVNIEGAGQRVTRIVEKVGTVTYPNLARGKTVFEFNQSNGFTFSGLTVDAQTYNAGDALDDGGDDTTIENSTFLGARNGSGTAIDPTNVFDLRIAADCNPSPSKRNYVGRVFHYGNVVRNVTVDGRGIGGNDDLDFSCQRDGTISNVVDTGWGTAIYLDRDVTVSNYRFTPGGPNKNFAGWYITDSSGISIDGFVTSGRGGIVAANPRYPSSDISITGERMTAPGFPLVIGDASDVSITNSDIAILKLRPDVLLDGLTVTGSLVDEVVRHPQPGATISGVIGLRS